MSRAKPASTEAVSGVASADPSSRPLNASPAVAPTSNSTTAPATSMKSSTPRRRGCAGPGSADTPSPTSEPAGAPSVPVVPGVAVMIRVRWSPG